MYFREGKAQKCAAKVIRKCRITPPVKLIWVNCPETLYLLDLNQGTWHKELEKGRKKERHVIATHLSQKLTY